MAVSTHKQASDQFFTHQICCGYCVQQYARVFELSGILHVAVKGLAVDCVFDPTCPFLRRNLENQKKKYKITLWSKNLFIYFFFLKWIHWGYVNILEILWDQYRCFLSIIKKWCIWSFFYRFDPQNLPFLEK